eukprot:scaffold118165_cov43-Cyclotella_meneghiniana.AAC.1
MADQAKITLLETEEGERLQRGADALETEPTCGITEIQGTRPPKLHMSLSRHLQNWVSILSSLETCRILKTCRLVVETRQDIVTHILGGCCRVASSP